MLNQQLAILRALKNLSVGVVVSQSSCKEETILSLVKHFVVLEEVFCHRGYYINFLSFKQNLSLRVCKAHDCQSSYDSQAETQEATHRSLTIF